MGYIAACHTDIGLKRKMNQDSMLIKAAQFKDGDVLLAVICDGMGGLRKGELASAEMIRNFNRWFDCELPGLIREDKLEKSIRRSLELLLGKVNRKLINYGRKEELELGTTVSGILLYDGHYYIVHVGDSRIYEFAEKANQLTADQTLVAKEVERGIITSEQAKKDSRRNILLQCIGTGEVIRPQFMIGRINENAVYMLCSDGFIHNVSEEELWYFFTPEYAVDKQTMKYSQLSCTALVKSRMEEDNISVISLRYAKGV